LESINAAEALSNERAHLPSAHVVWPTRRMNRLPAINPYKRHRFPTEVMSHCVRLYCRFCLSDRDVEALMAERGVTLTDEAVRSWCRTCGHMYANQLRHRHPRPGDTWHPDAAFLGIQGERHSLRRVVDQGGHGPDMLVQPRRDTAAAKTFFRKCLRGVTYAPRVLVTDNLRSDEAAQRGLLPGVAHRQHR
jgi:putative transposase